MELPFQLTPAAVRQMKRAMALSLIFGVVMLVGKVGAYWLTDSAAILSDAAESIVHVVAVGFAAFSLRLSLKPADHRFPFGYERITFFSAGFEGALIIVAAITIIYSAVTKWLAGLAIDRVGEGTLIIAGASVINGALGWYLVRTGRRNGSLILEANGKHVLTDCITSVGVVVGLALVLITGWKPFDPICAIVVALNILYSGGKLVWQSATGLMDYSDPEVSHRIRTRMDALSGKLGIQYHGLRIRSTGYRWRVEVHLLFPFATNLGEAHRQATRIEQQLGDGLQAPVEVVTHLEALEDHGAVHGGQHYTGRPE